MKKLITGFTLIELMIVIAIVAILAAVAIPQYLSYVRRSYLSEVNTAFAAIKNAEESYFSNNGCYVNAIQWPATVPAGGVPTTWGTGSGAWQASALNVRPDRQVRFQYEIYASNAYSSATGCDTSTAGKPLSIACVTDVEGIVPATIFPTHWYIAIARGDLDGDTVQSTIISAIDDSAIIMCNELE